MANEELGGVRISIFFEKSSVNWIKLLKLH